MGLSTAEQLEENEQYDKAYEEYKKLHEQKPKNTEYLQRLGHIAIILGKKDEAEEYYGKMLELDGTNIVAYEQLMDIYIHENKYKYYISRGNLHVVQGELSHAISDFKKALDKTHEEDEMNATRFVLANLYEQTGKPHSAIDEYLRILDTSGHDKNVYLQLAKLYDEDNMVNAAVETLERAIEHGLDSTDLKEALANLYLKNDQQEKAIELSSDDLVKARGYLDKGENQAAFDILDKSRDNYKKDAKFHSLLAQYYYNVKDWENALTEVEEFDKFEKNSPLTYQMRALIYEEKGMEFEAHINWAKYSLLRKDKDVALNEYLSAYQLNETDLVLLRNLAELIDDMGDRNHAAEYWEKLVKLDPTNKKALEKVADFKEEIGDYRGAIDILEKVYEKDNKNTIVVKKLAESYERIRNKDKALEYYNRFVAISPVNKDYEKAKEKIKKLENVEMVQEDEGLLDKIMKLFSK